MRRVVSPLTNIPDGCTIVSSCQRVPMSLPYDPSLIANARELRRNMTPEEKRLWYHGLRNMAHRFQRQKTIGHYIVDFYCHAARLAIELDGSQHFTEEAKAYDERRTAFLNSQGVAVLRFRNESIEKHLNEVILKIDCVVKERISVAHSPPAPPGHPPPGGGKRS